MPLVYQLNSIQSLTSEDIAYIKARIAQDNLFDVQFMDADGEVMIPVGYKDETVSEGVVTAAPVVTVIKNGSVVKASVEPTIVKLGLIMPSDAIGETSGTKPAFVGALYSDGEVKLCVDKTANTKCIIGTSTKGATAWGDPSFVISPSPATTSTKIAIDTIPNILEVKALNKLEVEQSVSATKCTINGYDSPVPVKTGDTTPVSVDLDNADVLMTYEA